jgi:hypothetical protein
MTSEGLADLRRESGRSTLPSSSQPELSPADPPLPQAAALNVLLVSTFAWSTAGRLAVALDEAGFVVDAVAPPNSVVHGIVAVRRSHRLSLIRPVSSLRRLIEDCRPDLVIPSDDPSRQALHSVYASADPTSARGEAVRECLVRSLGAPETYDWIYSRAMLMDIALQRGLCAPPTSLVTTEAAASAWQRRHAGPVVMKTDGSWGGRGVEIVHTADEVASAWRRLTTPPNATRVLKRLFVDRTPWPLRDRLTGRQPVVSIQTYVPGHPANVAVSCLDGEVVAAVTAEVVVSTRPTGPATVLKVIDHPEMTATAASIVKALHLTGLCGFDFVLDPSTGRAHLVELNPRATPTSHLLTADGSDPLRSLAASMREQAPPERQAPYSEGLVALFPQELERDPQSEYLARAHHDIPAHAEDFVAKAGTTPVQRVRRDVRAAWLM